MRRRTGWTGDLTLYGQSVNQVTLAPAGFNTLNVQLALHAPITATAGTITYTVTATSLIGGAQFDATGTVQVTESRCASGHRLRPDVDLARREWHVASASEERRRAKRHLRSECVRPVEPRRDRFTPNSVTLSPGQAQTVQLQVTASTEAQAGTLLLGALAQSQSDNTVRD